MENMLIFLRAALPWLVPGLTFAVLLAGNVKKKPEKTGDYGMEGMCLGMSIGCSIGVNDGIGLSLGLLIGLVIGSCIRKEQEGE